MKRLLFATVLLASCASATPQEKKAAAEATYGSELALCLERPTRAESDACASDVRKRWPRDAGGDQ